MSICLFIEANWTKYVLCAFVHIHVTIIKEEMNLEGVGEGREGRAGVLMCGIFKTH